MPTALGLVFDTSLSMGYKENGQDAARRGQGAGTGHPRQDARLEPGLRGRLVPSRARRSACRPRPARKRIEDLTIHPVNRPLNAAMGQVYPAVAECDRPRHEVYVLTDLARTSWNPEQPAEGLDQVEKAKTTPGGKIATFILRLGTAEVEDVAIDSARASVDRGDPGRSRSRFGAGSRPGIQASQPRRRVLSRRREER